MSTERIDGEYQIEPGTIVDASIAAGANIASTKLAAWSANRNANNFKLTNLQPGSSANDAVTYSQLLAVANGSSYKDPVRVASTANVAGTYNATGGASGRGQFTAMPNTLDGVSLAANDRVLLKDQSSGAQNGIWVVSTLGTGSNGVWDRAEDFDADSEVLAGLQIPVTEGTTNQDTVWLLTTNNPIVIGGGSGTALTFQGMSTILAGAGMSQTGNTFNINAANASILVGTNDISVQLSGSTLAIDGSGLKVADAGITPTQLASGVAGPGLNGGAGTALSVDWRQDVFTGDNSTTVFALSGSPIGNKAVVSVKGVIQIPGTDYTISGTSLTFTTAPRNNWHVQASYVAI